mmetsp:Transcript_15340/g.34983  ORF Transcript_15340/g.34983 Transcript_15340/m.34983 type:complete len:314 (+) Transcript_15340:80-1021(+)
MPNRQSIRRVILVAALGALAAQYFGCAWVSPTPQKETSASLGRRGVAAGLVAGLTGIASQAEAYELPPLPYDFDALEPHIDKETMQIHHDKHHNTYVVNINKALEGKTQPPLVEMQKSAIKTGPAFRNSGGGAYNHNFFWLEMAAEGTGGKPSDKLAKAIDDGFGSMDSFKEKFEAAGAPGARFGSGWVWLVVRPGGKLEITSTPNQDNPLMEGVDGGEGIPILGIDVWEHAYYLKYQWQRPAYIKAWWNVVNWNQVNAWYEGALSGKAPTTETAYVGAAFLGERQPRGETAPLKGAGVGFKLNFEAGVQFGS